MIRIRHCRRRTVCRIGMVGNGSKTKFHSTRINLGQQALSRCRDFLTLRAFRSNSYFSKLRISNPSLKRISYLQRRSTLLYRRLPLGHYARTCRSNLMLTVRLTFLSSTSIPEPFTKECPAFTGKVLVITADGRTLTGTLLSCDQLTNLVLQNTIERVIRPHDDHDDSEEVSHGLYLIRGENVAICGLLDEQMDGEIDWARVKGNVIGGVKHT